MKELSLALLFYNEEKSVEEIINELTKIFLDNKVNFELVAVDNGSTDKTAEFLKKIKKKNKNVRVVTIDKNIGYGYGVRKGLENCRGRFVGYCWGDNQIFTEDIFKVYKKISSDASISLCKGKRTIREGIMRKFVSRTYNTLFKILFSTRLNDINACPKIMKIEDYQSVELIQNDWFVDAEIVLKISSQNKKIVEVPISYRKRKSGNSKVNWKTAFEFLIDILRYRFNKTELVNRHIKSKNN